jgi:hypothetical protein
MTTIAERVQAGATLLDEKRPGWWQDVSISNLAMSLGRSCVLGQLFGSFYDGQDDLDLSVEDSVKHGFDRSSDLEYTALGNAWKALIRERRSQATARPAEGQGERER